MGFLRPVFRIKPRGILEKKIRQDLESIFSTIIQYTYRSELLFGCPGKVLCPSRDHSTPGHLYLQGDINALVCKDSLRNKQLKDNALKKNKLCLFKPFCG